MIKKLESHAQHAHIVWYDPRTFNREGLMKDSTSPGIINVRGDEKGNGITKNIKVFIHDSLGEEDKKVIYSVLEYQLEVEHVPIDALRYLLVSTELPNIIKAFKGLILFKAQTEHYMQLFILPKKLKKQYAIVQLKKK